MVRCWVWGDSCDGLPVLLRAAAGCSAADELRLLGGWVPACAGMTEGARRNGGGGDALTEGARRNDGGGDALAEGEAH